jgi:glyoxylase-like metal-dependent hydrolase (beta-lactamase superfamily II)
MLTRRRVLTTVAAALAAPLAPRRLWAASTLTLGSIQIDTLSDGSLILPGDFILGGMPQDELQAIVTKYGLPTDQLTPPCNVTLLRDGTNTVLFDVGAGPDFQPTAGKIGEALDAIGLTADDITHVLFTHAHPDHLWGLLDEFDEPVFPNAQLMIGQAEFDYWMNPDTVNTIGEARTTFAVGAQRRLQTVAETLRFLADGEEPLPGIMARLTPGHTPGHLAYEIGGSTPAMILGDCIGNHHVGFERPDWASGSDQDKDMAAATRVALLDRLAAEKHAIIGYHLPNGGIGRAEQADTGYRFVEDL